jgi:hypothetical protein
MKDKLVRLSEPSWRKVKDAAYTQDTYIKTVLEDLINEKLTPSKM